MRSVCFAVFSWILKTIKEAKKCTPVYKWNDDIVLRKFHKDGAQCECVYKCVRACICTHKCIGEWINFSEVWRRFNVMLLLIQKHHFDTFVYFAVGQFSRRRQSDSYGSII